MPASEIETLIKAAFPDADVVIEDLRGDGDHYACRVVSTAFAGKSRVQQHQMVYKALGIDLQATTMERIVRVTSALSGLGASAMVAAHVGLQREWRGPIVEAAMDALGHAGKPKRPARKRA